VETALDKALEHFSQIDVLVNGAAGNFLCPASKLSYNGIKTGIFALICFGETIVTIVNMVFFFSGCNP